MKTNHRNITLCILFVAVFVLGFYSGMICYIHEQLNVGWGKAVDIFLHIHDDKYHWP